VGGPPLCCTTAFTNVGLSIQQKTNRIVPFRIKHYPGVVLDVVLSSSGENTSAIAGRNRDTASASTEEGTENLQTTPPLSDTSSSDDGAFMLSRASMLPSTDAHSDFERKPRVYLAPKLITTPARQDPIQSKMEQQRMRRTHKVVNSRIHHHIHLAKHGGYDITHLKEFFHRYGLHFVAILQMLKYGITAAGVAIPAFSHLLRPDAMGQITEDLRSLRNTLEPG